MRAGAFSTLVRKLINSGRTSFGSDKDIFGELCSDLGVIQIELEHFYEEGVNKSVLYSKYDTTMLNEADYSENLNFEFLDVPIHLSFWFDYDITEPDVERGECVNLLAGILKLNLSRYMKLDNAKSARTHDMASGILNSRGFIDEGQNLLDKGFGDRFTCLYINVAKFKVVNQLYGHDAGDHILTQVARDISVILSNQTKEYLVGRLSGDSYVCLVDNNLVDRFLEQLANFSVRFRSDDGDVDLALSFYIGIYKLEIDDEDMSLVLENASTAYSMARQNGNLMPVYYDMALRDRLLREKDIESRMRGALENHEFVVYYQPKIDLTDYSLMGAEALVRWMDNDKVIPPDEFVPLFERNGFICNIDFFVLNSTCRAIRDWLDKGMDVVPISVNFSKVHFSNAGFYKQIVETIRHYHVPPKYIEIEFTESVDVADKEKLVQAVEYLKSYGLTTSMDDFGTGYSSLSLLKNLPVDVLKIDKSLLDARTPHERVIISNVVRMVNEMNIKVITEGVETPEQAEFLKKIQCSAAQGYLFDKPLRREKFEERLAKGYYEENELTQERV